MFLKGNEAQDDSLFGNVHLPLDSSTHGVAYKLELREALQQRGLSYNEQMPGFAEYAVESGDTLWRIADIFTDSPLNYLGIKEADGTEFTEWEARRLQIGSKTYIALDEITGLPKPLQIVIGGNHSSGSSSQDGYSSHIVKRNDTLWDIANSQFGSSEAWTTIRDSSGEAFDISSAKRLQAGQEILLPEGLLLENANKFVQDITNISENENKTSDGTEENEEDSSTTTTIKLVAESPFIYEVSANADITLQPLLYRTFRFGNKTVTVTDSKLSAEFSGRTIQPSPEENPYLKAKTKLNEQLNGDLEAQISEWLILGIDDLGKGENGIKPNVSTKIAEASNGDPILLKVGGLLFGNRLNLELSRESKTKISDNLDGVITTKSNVELSINNDPYTPRDTLVTEPIPVVDPIPVFNKQPEKPRGVNGFPRPELAKINMNLPLPTESFLSTPRGSYTQLPNGKTIYTGEDRAYRQPINAFDVAAGAAGVALAFRTGAIVATAGAAVATEVGKTLVLEGLRRTAPMIPKFAKGF
jgi:LysM repeat protein